MSPQQQLQSSQNPRLGALKVFLSFCRDCRQRYLEGDTNCPQRRITNCFLKRCMQYTDFRRTTTTSLHLSWEFTLSKTQIFGKITFESQTLISKVHVILDDIKMLLRKSLLLFWNFNSFMLFTVGLILSWWVYTELNWNPLKYSQQIIFKCSDLKIRFSYVMNCILCYSSPARAFPQIWISI